MESFSADWLALREPVDHAARAGALVETLAEHLAGDDGRRLATVTDGHRDWHAIDLAGGTGSNVRYLLPRLPGVSRWTLVDHDEALLTRATALVTPLARAAGVSVATARVDLRALDALPLDGTALVTASALLDLVSEAWLRAFARRCREARAAVLCTLSYDGRIACTPGDPDDTLVRDLVNRHQRTDKGFGVALGPDAAAVAVDAFQDEGFAVRTASSDWVLDNTHPELQRQLLEGWAGAARAMSPADAAAIDAWLQRRLAHGAAGTSRVRVGHTDVLATLP